MDLLLYIVRFLHYTSALQLFGVAVFQAWITSPKLQHAMSEVSGRVAIVSAAVLLVSGVARLLIVAGSMGSGWADTVNPAVVGTVLRSTQFGQIWTWHLGIALLVLPAAALAGRTRAGWSVLAILSALSLGGLGLIGHAATLDGSVGLLNRASHILHALSSGFWLGSLVPLIYTLEVSGGMIAVGHPTGMPPWSRLNSAAARPRGEPRRAPTEPLQRSARHERLRPDRVLVRR